MEVFRPPETVPNELNTQDKLANSELLTAGASDAEKTP